MSSDAPAVPEPEPASAQGEAPDSGSSSLLAPPSLSPHASSSSASPVASISVSAPSSTGANTPSTVPATPALSSHYANPSIPPTPSEFSGALNGAFVPNPALALDSPARELGNLSLAPTPSPPLSEHASSASTAEAMAGPGTGGAAPPPLSPSGPVTAAESVLARTSAGQQALREGVLPGARALAVPMPGPAPLAGTTPDAGNSTVATPGDSRAGTPAVAPVPRREPSTLGAAPKRPGLEPPTQQKKSVFGKLFGDKNASSVSLAASEAMDRSAAASADGGSVSGAGGAAAPVLVRRPSGGVGVDKKREEKEREKREKAERKDRERRDKEARKEAERARSASRSRVPSQSGRPRSDSKGGTVDGKDKDRKDEGGAASGVMDFMRIKVQRKTSVTSRKSDDGRSDGEGRSQYGGSTKEETRSRGGQSNASLTKKYGVCDKVIVGKGATAVVRLAHKWDRSTEKLYAVKEFRKRRKNETEKEYVKKLTSEFCISSTLHHQNVVETVDLVQDEQQHWCEVMEFCPGGDLYAVIKKGDLGPAVINSYFKQILQGVAYLHSMGVAHRDIKPENLLLDAKGHIKITDFGVSDVFRMCWERTTHLSKGLCGSEPYIAPEQYERAEYDARLVDVWAVAIVYYCCTFQELPWRVAKRDDGSFGPYAQLYKTSTSTPPPLSNLVPRECRSVIRRMLNPDPAARLTVDEVLADPWVASLAIVPPLQ
ncbi:hypothetical protein JCM3770_001487 [Rhodotorula araucariae]